MNKITLILGLVMLFAALPAMAGRSPDGASLVQDGLDRPLVPDGSSDAERKLLNGDAYGKPEVIPQDSDEEDQGNHHCKNEEDCERED